MKVSFKNYTQEACLHFGSPPAPHKHTNTTSKQENYCKCTNRLQISYAEWNRTAFAALCSPETTLLWGQTESQACTVEDQGTLQNGNKDGETQLWPCGFLPPHYGWQHTVLLWIGIFLAVFSAGKSWETTGWALLTRIYLFCSLCF